MHYAQPNLQFFKYKNFKFIKMMVEYLVSLQDLNFSIKHVTKAKQNIGDQGSGIFQIIPPFFMEQLKG